MPTESNGHTRFEPMGHTKNRDIPIAKSLVDYIFRWLGTTFIPGYREENSPAYPQESDSGGSDDPTAEPSPAAKRVGGQTPQATKHHGGTNGKAGSNGSSATARVGTSSLPDDARQAQATILDRAGVEKIVAAGDRTSSRAEQFASFQLDAPSCDKCGAITVRNGNCYLCYNCGNSMGCS